MLVKIPIFFLLFLFSLFPKWNTENALWSWGQKAWWADSCWMQTKTILDSTLFGVPSRRIFPLFPIAVERNGLGMGSSKLCVRGRQMKQERMNLKQQKDDWDLVSRCTNLETNKITKEAIKVPTLRRYLQCWLVNELSLSFSTFLSWIKNYGPI